MGLARISTTTSFAAGLIQAVSFQVRAGDPMSNLSQGARWEDDKSPKDTAPINKERLLPAAKAIPTLDVPGLACFHAVH